MKTIKKLLAIVFILAGLLFNLNKVSAQCYPINYPLPTPLHAEVQSPSGIVAIMTGPGGNSCATPGTALTYFGISNANPQFITDILGTAIGDGVNVSGPNNNAVGYSIGGSAIGGPTMFLWHSGDPTSVYCGIVSGFSNSSIASVGSFYNTFVGFASDESFMGVNGMQNTAVGAFSLWKNISNYNTAVGYDALQLNTKGANNTGIGVDALYTNTTGQDNTAIGYKADVGSGNLTNVTAIGANAIVTTNNTTVLGSSKVTQTEFNGALMPNNGGNYNAGTKGQVLTSQGAGVAPQWATIGNTDNETTITPKGNAIHNSIILKASDGDTYFTLTVNSKGELKVTPVEKETL